MTYQLSIKHMTNKLNPQLKLFIQISKSQAILNRAFDNKLSGISSTEFIILNHLNLSPNKSLRRSDLAEKIGLTPSGITRLLLPMEKIGLVGTQLDERDARVKFVTLTSGGESKLNDEIEYANIFFESKIPSKNIETISNFFEKIN